MLCSSADASSAAADAAASSAAVAEENWATREARGSLVRSVPSPASCWPLASAAAIDSIVPFVSPLKSVPTGKDSQLIVDMGDDTEEGAP
jgi:hypothetical protein